jgi:hypothetical protein
MDNTYLKALEDARKELQGLIQERAQLDDRIARLSRSIEGLASLCDDTDHSNELKTKLIELELSDSMGMTDAIRAVISSSIFPVSATAIRDALVAEGFDSKNYSNMLTVIHNTLLRLERQGEIQRAANLLGLRGWMKRPKPGVAMQAVELGPKKK